MTAAERSRGEPRDEWTAEMHSAVDADVGGGIASSSPAADMTARDKQPLARGVAVLVVKRGPRTGSHFRLDRPVMTAGRHPESDIFLDDITVSRRHAEFRRENGKYHVVDNGSLNSTYVNRQPVESAALADGDEVQIGNFRLIFFAGPPIG